MCLFCQPDGTCDWCEERWPEWFNGGPSAVEFHKSNVTKGLHPFGFELHPDRNKKCGGCAHRYRKSRNKSWWKCEKFPATGGLGTDIRLKWRACEWYREGV